MNNIIGNALGVMGFMASTKAYTHALTGENYVAPLIGAGSLFLLAIVILLVEISIRIRNK